MRALARKSTPFFLSMALGLCGAASHAADSTPEPYGSAKFAAYADMNSLKQLKSVWDWSFEDPAQADVSMNFIGAHLRATHEFGPAEIDPIRTVVVFYGPEVALVYWQNKGYACVSGCSSKAVRPVTEFNKMDLGDNK